MGKEKKNKTANRLLSKEAQKTGLEERILDREGRKGQIISEEVLIQDLCFRPRGRHPLI